ncbi:MAG TPA: TIM barrel protein [Bacteroidales bacterium]|nr:TIM barrel protein [Bacteroidales bacterium]HPF02503.1 TIM barrel protein [Bacteroidales bacterium]HPJ59049.1 TIM barrel protein [Bacteroidales bacterium]HPR13159.1 TIM barrel protein [Bacteroidales bacterium]HRW84739.1 TIM barrel protein [Bacteroidales bacterium]
MKQNRRKFISTITAAGAAVPFMSFDENAIFQEKAEKFPLRLFSKPLDGYDFSFMCECLAEAGIGGFDLTVRPKGKVEPAEVEDKLPPFVSQARKYGLKLDMMVTGITEAEDPLTVKVLKTASSLGITHYRLGYWNFDYATGIWESLQRHKESLGKIVSLNGLYKIHGDYQNHAGTRVGGPVWDLFELLRGFPPDLVGCQYDVRHAMVEGANAWILGMRLISPYIKTLAIKDFTWMTVNNNPRAVTVPMGEGMVNWDLFFKTVKEMNITVPLTLHVEYELLDKSEQQLPLLRQKEIIVGKLRKDVDFLKGLLNKYQLL